MPMDARKRKMRYYSIPGSLKPKKKTGYLSIFCVSTLTDRDISYFGGIFLKHSAQMRKN